MYGSAIFWASANGDGATVRLLLDAGTEVRSERFPRPFSALHAAADNGHAAIVAMLINSGVDVNLNNGKPLDFKDTALGLASMRGSDKLAKVLVEAGADPESKSRGLHIASQKGRDEVVKVLLGAGANPNQGWKLASPLREAVKNGHLTTVKILLDAGADVKLGGNWNEDFLHPWINPTKHQELLQLLVVAGAEVVGMKSSKTRWRFNNTPTEIQPSRYTPPLRMM